MDNSFSKQEVKLISFLLIFSAVLAVLGIITKSLNSKVIPLTPFSKTVNVFSLLKNYEKPKSVVYGYLPYWSLNRIEYLQMDKLTDIAYFGLYLNSDGTFMKTTIGEDGYQITEPGYNNWKNNEAVDKVIKASNEYGVRFSLTVIAHSDADTDAFLNCRSCWDTFWVNLKKELKDKKIKDVNLNFEHAEYTTEDIALKYNEFVKFINNKLDTEFGDSFLVTSAFADSLIKPRITSELAELSQYVDGIFIMAYDFHRPTSDVTGPVAPIDGKGVHSEYDIRTMLNDYLAKTPPNKLIFGVPYYGYNWVITRDANKYNERMEGSENVGYSQSQTYSAIMETILSVKPQVLWDDLGQVPYFKYTSPETGSIREVFFENEQSLKVKYDLVKQNNLAGIGIWALGYDGGYAELWNLIYDEFIR